MKYKYLNEVLLDWGNSEDIQDNSIISSDDIKFTIEKEKYLKWKSRYCKDDINEDTEELLPFIYKIIEYNEYINGTEEFIEWFTKIFDLVIQKIVLFYRSKKAIINAISSLIFFGNTSRTFDSVLGDHIKKIFNDIMNNSSEDYKIWQTILNLSLSEEYKSKGKWTLSGTRTFYTIDNFLQIRKLY